jgi:hypothetical protein
MFRGLSEKAQLMIRDYIKMILEQQQALQPEYTTPPALPPDFPLEPRRPAADFADPEEKRIVG